MKKFALIALLLSNVALAHQTYVVPTYGNGAIVPILQNELNQGDGGSVSYYQGKLIIHASTKDYARLQSLLAQIDTAPSPIALSVFVGENANSQSTTAHIGIGIDSRVRVLGDVNHQTTHRQSQSTYQVRGTAGLPMTISKSTLLGLSGIHTVSARGVQWRFFDTAWISLTDGFVATATPLPNGQIRLELTQSQSGQTLTTTLTATQGQWTKIGEIRQASASNGGQMAMTMPIWVRVD